MRRIYIRLLYMGLFYSFSPFVRIQDAYAVDSDGFPTSVGAPSVFTCDCRAHGLYSNGREGATAPAPVGHGAGDFSPKP